MAEIFRAQAAGRQQAFGAGFLQPHEQAEFGDAGDAGLEDGADMRLHIGGDIAVGGIALRRHGAALGHGDVLRRSPAAA